MPYTASQLAQFYNNLTFGNPPSAATTAVFNNAAAANASGAITDAQAFAAVNYMLPGVRATVDVAVATYALFTGATPTMAGINYLINNPGTGYNTSYYNGVGGSAAAPGPGGFNTENRYYNAAMNLAGNPGAVGNAAFVQTYGSLSLAQTVSTAYNQIIGVSAVGSTAAAAAIASITSALPYFQALAATRVVSGGSVDIATKAIILGYILEEGIKADVGVYAKALDGFNFALANGAGVYNTNLLTAFGAGGTNFNASIQPLSDGQNLNATGAAATTSVGVAANGVATLAVGASPTLTFTGDIAVNNGQVIIAQAGAATGAADTVNLRFTGQNISAAPSVIAAGVETITVSAELSGPVVAGTTLSIDIQDPQLTTLTIAGNESVVYSAPLYAFADGTFSGGALRSVNASGATAAANIDVSSASLVTVTGSALGDTLQFRSGATITGGGGNDTFIVYAPPTVGGVSSITDEQAGETIGFFGLRITSFNAAPVTATTLQSGLDAAAAGGAGRASYFVFGGDTYLVADASAATAFQPGTDSFVRLVGVHNLATSTINAQGQIVSGG